jgi:invasion protein IalB
MRILMAVALAALALPVAAQQAVTLPGGASAATETHGDWTVRCQVRQPEGKIGCLVQQEQLDNQSHQRLLAVEMLPGADSVVGTLILPFGLDLDKGVSLAVDDGQPMSNLRFRTCLPQGCLVPLTFTPEILPALRSGGALKVAATADGGAPTPFTISLNGFSSALARAQELTR